MPAPVFPLSIACLRGLTAAVALVAAAPAFGEARLTAQYAIAVAGIPIGRGELRADIGDEAYVAKGSGRAAGFLRILLSGEAQISARGQIVDGHPSPTVFSAKLDDEDEHSAVVMTFEAGTVKDLQAETSLPASERVPVSAEHRRNVSDPVSALLVPAPEGGAPGPSACQRTLRIFDGYRRYDLALAYKRIDTGKAEGFAAPVIVCAVTLKPIAGHKPGSALLKYLTGGRELELWLAPIAGTHLVGPYRLSISNLIGDLVITATSFKVSLPPQPAALPLRPSIATDAPE